MKNSVKVILFVISISVSFYLTFVCFDLLYKKSCTSYYSQLMEPDHMNYYLDPLFGLPLFCIPLILLISFVVKYPLKGWGKIIVICCIPILLFTWFGGLMLRGYGINMNYLFIQIWNFSGTLWALLLALPFKQRISFIHWPFDSRKEKQ